MLNEDQIRRLEEISRLPGEKQADEMVAKARASAEQMQRKIEKEVDTYGKRDKRLNDKYFKKFEGNDARGVLLARQLADKIEFQDERFNEELAEIERRSVEEFSNRTSEFPELPEVK